MRMRFKILFIIALAASISSFAIGGYEQSKTEKKGSKDDLYAQVELFSDAISIIRSDYVDEVESKKLIYGALKGMLSSLDDFSQFMEPDEYKEIKLETKGEFGGVGIEISTKDGVLTVITPISGTPADLAGIKPGDNIVRIDGKITKDMRLSDAVKLMRGNPGTQVTLTIWREKGEKILELAIKRDIIKVKSIREVILLEDKIGYIKLVEFQERTPRDLEEALKKLEGDGMDSLILDLRNNPGGLLDVAVDVAEKFLPKGSTIVSIKARLASQNAVFKSTGRFPHPAYPVIVLANEGSASASEIVAGALQDNKRGIILGTKTFGKASVQTVIPLKDGSALRLTSASYFTPNGRMIREQGIIPDVAAEREEARDKAKDERADIFEKLEEKGVEQRAESKGQRVKTKEKLEHDNQLERALDLMKALRVYKSDKGPAII